MQSPKKKITHEAQELVRLRIDNAITHYMLCTEKGEGVLRARQELWEACQTGLAMLRETETSHE